MLTNDAIWCANFQHCQARVDDPFELKVGDRIFSVFISEFEPCFSPDSVWEDLSLMDLDVASPSSEVGKVDDVLSIKSPEKVVCDGSIVAQLEDGQEEGRAFLDGTIAEGVSWSPVEEVARFESCLDDFQAQAFVSQTGGCGVGANVFTCQRSAPFNALEGGSGSFVGADVEFCVAFGGNLLEESHIVRYGESEFVLLCQSSSFSRDILKVNAHDVQSMGRLLCVSKSLLSGDPTDFALKNINGLNNSLVEVSGEHTGSVGVGSLCASLEAIWNVRNFGSKLKAKRKQFGSVDGHSYRALKFNSGRLNSKFDIAPHLSNSGSIDIGSLEIPNFASESCSSVEEGQLSKIPESNISVFSSDEVMSNRIKRKHRKFGSLLDIQEKVLSKSEIKKRDRALKRLNLLKSDLNFSELSDNSLSDSDLKKRSQLKDAIVEGGVPFERAYGTNGFEYLRKDPRLNQVFSTAMVNHSNLVLKIILDRYKGFEQLGSRLVDVGGSLGVTLGLITSKYPSINGINFDLPHVIQHAPAYPGVEHVGGDMFECVPKGDAIFMKCILHDWDDDHCVKLLKNCYNAIPDDGKVIVVDVVVSTVPEANSYSRYTTQMDVLMMAISPGGKERTKPEFESLATKAGFSGIRYECFVCNFWIMEFFK
ncbi:Caffeic acid 3-O-methyltransferase [Hibiscus syriacus]|uniref:Caffeic acid 3-O-methyltransferase n=1 Tax=Hibiscus syriacus TaxID=106335 RepID=A0A6A2YV68_HIBSY|nr:Caffeic acid 3-O-methyltransferase [Hibiscus syriacus]